MPKPTKAHAWQTEDRLKLLEHWKRNGLTDAEVAKKIGISVYTLNDWKRKYPQITTALKKGFEDLLISAEEALMSRFEIQTITEEKEEIWQDPNGGIKKHKTITKKQVMPDTTAVIFYLKAKGGWRDNIDLTKTVNSITNERRKELEEAFNAEQPTESAS